jgi:hypothetical protein
VTFGLTLDKVRQLTTDKYSMIANWSRRGGDACSATTPAAPGSGGQASGRLIRPLLVVLCQDGPQAVREFSESLVAAGEPVDHRVDDLIDVL